MGDRDRMTMDAPTAAVGAARWATVAAVLLALGVAVQLRAAAERWPSPSLDDPIESHERDYLVPSDPWEPVGIAAQLQGGGFLLLAVATVAAALAVRATRTALPGGALAAFAAAATLPPALLGIHGIVSGILGVPSPLASLLVGSDATLLGFAAPLAWTAVHLVGLAGLALAAARRAPLLAIGVALLVGGTHLGYAVAAIGVAPIVAGTTSYDTTPWSEAAFAWLQAPAAVVLGASAVVALMRTRRRAAAGRAAAPDAAGEAPPVGSVSDRHESPR